MKILKQIEIPSYVARKQGLTPPLPYMQKAEVYELTSALDKLTPSLAQFHKCVTRELPKRPLPYEYKDKNSKLDLFSAVVSEMLPLIYKNIGSKMTVPIMTYEKRSRVGGPYYTHMSEPGEKVKAVLEAFHDLENLMGLNTMTIINKRLQVDRLGKERLFSFIRDLGHGEAEIYDELITDEQRLVDGYYSSRTRLVFNYFIGNLIKQVADNAIHQVFLNSKTFHHDMTRAKARPLRKHKWFSDVDHWERIMGRVIVLRAKLIGELYERIEDKCLSDPYIVVDDSWESAWLVNIEKGKMQLGSGDSAVSASAKEAKLALYAKYMQVYHNMDPSLAIDAILWNPESLPIVWWNSGDDEVATSDDPDELNQFIAFSEEHTDVKEEKEPTFLGYRYFDETGNWQLRLASLVNNFYRPEKIPLSNFRTWFYYAFYDRRRIYYEMGTPECVEFLNKEIEFLSNFTDMYEFARLARIQSKQVANLPTNYVLGKEYLLTPHERVALGLADIMPQHETKLIYDSLLKGGVFGDTTFKTSAIPDLSR